MRPDNYIGITGFMNRFQVDALLHNFVPGRYRKLMIGVLASSKTLRGGRNKWPGRYPAVTDIPWIFSDHQDALNLIHFATDNPDMFDSELSMLSNLAGPYLHGFQLNIVWPNPLLIQQALNHIFRIRKREFRIVLQINKKTMDEIENEPGKLVSRLEEYTDIVTDILLDSSAGLGKDLDPQQMRDLVTAVLECHPNLGIGIAGGLCAETVSRIGPCFCADSHLSIDAEGRLRTEFPEDSLNYKKAAAYLMKAVQLHRMLFPTT